MEGHGAARKSGMGVLREGGEPGKGMSGAPVQDKQAEVELTLLEKLGDKSCVICLRFSSLQGEVGKAQHT